MCCEAKIERGLASRRMRSARRCGLENSTWSWWMPCRRVQPCWCRPRQENRASACRTWAKLVSCRAGYPGRLSPAETVVQEGRRVLASHGDGDATGPHLHPQSVGLGDVAGRVVVGEDGAVVPTGLAEPVGAELAHPHAVAEPAPAEKVNPSAALSIRHQVLRSRPGPMVRRNCEARMRTHWPWPSRTCSQTTRPPGMDWTGSIRSIVPRPWKTGYRARKLLRQFGAAEVDRLPRVVLRVRATGALHAASQRCDRLGCLQVVDRRGLATAGAAVVRTEHLLARRTRPGQHPAVGPRGRPQWPCRSRPRRRPGLRWCWSCHSRAWGWRTSGRGHRCGRRRPAPSRPRRGTWGQLAGQHAGQIHLDVEVADEKEPATIQSVSEPA